MSSKLKKIRLLHLGNIANNSYLNSKLLRQKGIKADVLCYDYYYVMGSPEWEEVEIEGDWGNDFNPDWSKINLHGFRRPDWFYQGPLETLGSKILRKEKYSFSKKERQKNWLVILYEYLSRSKAGAQLLRTIKIPRIKIEVFFNKYFSSKKNENPELKYWRSLVGDFKRFFPERRDQLSLEDILLFRNKLEIMKKIFQNYDLIQAHATDPIYPLLANKHPYVAFEHGTIRDIPFENSPIGRLTALAYRKADLVFITNSDNIKAARKLGLKNFVAIPHPVLDQWHKKLKTRVQKDRRKNEIIIFCPARHDWDVKGIDKLIRALPKAIRNSRQKVKIIFLKWGEDVKKSSDLLKKLGVEKNVYWEKALPRFKLAYWMLRADIVADQFILSAMGAIAPEAMLAGKPVLMSYRHEICRWMYPEEPPIIKVYSQQDIEKELIKLIRDQKLRENIGAAGKRWFEKYHSQRVYLRKVITAYERVLNHS